MPRFSVCHNKILICMQSGCLYLIRIPAVSIYRAQFFYTKVFGWTFKRMNPSGVGYPRSFFEKGNLRGYMTEMPPDQISSAMHGYRPGYSVSSIDETSAEIIRAGGKANLYVDYLHEKTTC